MVIVGADISVAIFRPDGIIDFMAKPVSGDMHMRNFGSLCMSVTRGRVKHWERCL